MNHKDYNIINLEFRGTKGQWMLPHLASDSTTCDCGFVLNEGYCGAIATIHWSKDRSIENGDNPPLSEAKANAMLISAAPDLLEACDDLLQYWLGTYGESYVTEAAQVAISKAVGKPYKEIAETKTECINDNISAFDLLNNKLQHACNLMNQMYECLYKMDNPMDLSDIEAFIRENDKTPKPEKESDTDIELPF